MRFLLIFILSSLLFVTNCAKLPEKFVTPFLTVSAEYKDNKIIYTVTLKAGVVNENSNVVLKDCKGECLVKDSETSFSFPFDIPSVFPFETFVVTIIKKGDAEEMKSIFDIFHVDRDKLDKDGIVDEINIQQDNIILKRISCDSVSIFKMLSSEKKTGDRSNEANK